MKIILTFMGMVMSGLLSLSVAQAEELPGAPTLLVPPSRSHTSLTQPTLAGVTQSGTQVDIYIDNQFNGHAVVAEIVGPTASWTYVPFLHLSHGWHTVTAKAQDAAGRRSAVSQPQYIFVDLLVPAPTMFTPVVNTDTDYRHPWIIGLSIGGMQLDVYIDGVLNGRVLVDGSSDAVEHFRYRPFLALDTGTHQVMVVAHDANGGTSPASQLRFSVVQPLAQSTEVATPSVAQTAVQADTETSPTAIDEAIVSVEPEAAPNQDSPAAEPVVQPTQPEQESVESADISAASGDTDVLPEDNPSGEKRKNTLSTIGWVLLAIVAIAMITRGRVKKEVPDELVKIDTTTSLPHVEVIRGSAEQTPAQNPPVPSTPPTTPLTPPTSPPTPPTV